MENITLDILCTNGIRILSYCASIDLFHTANKVAAANGINVRIQIRIISSADNPLCSLYPQLPVLTIQEYLEGDMGNILLIPAFDHYDMVENIRNNSDYIPAIIQARKAHKDIVCLCTGTFLAAAAGILDGITVSTHIDAIPALQHHFPKVIVQPEAVVTSQDGIYTSGGATSSFLTKLKIIETYLGAAIAVEVSKIFAIDLDRKNQLYFETKQYMPQHEDSIVTQLQTYISDHFSEIKSIESAIQEIPSSRRNIIRKFKQATGLTPIHYLQKIKINAAKKLLEQTNDDITSVMVQTGYGDLKSFRMLFKKMTGLTPTAYRQKYNLFRAS